MKFISTITGYLIQKSYFKCNTNRIYYFFENYNFQNQTKRFIDKNALINLRSVGNTESSSLELYYNIIEEQLCVLKKSKQLKFFDREMENYLNNSHEFMPLFFGKFDETEQELFFEYIDGETLLKISNFKFNYQQKLKIIFELLIVFNYLHHKGYIYRDLKPNNIIISRNHQIVLIDFDQMVLVGSQNENEEHESTTDLGNNYTAPEIKRDGKYSIKSDIYSIGCIIFYIMMEEELNLDLNAKFKQKYNKIYDIYIKCISNIPSQRPSIDELIDYFKEILSNLIPEMKEYIFLLEKINEALINNQDISLLQYQIGLEYFEGNNIKRNIDMALYYFTLSSKEKNHQAQFYLGLISYLKKDIDNALYYFTLAANQNNPNAQFYLGLIYNEGKFVEKDINKAIYYFKLASDQNISEAQYNLGLILYLKKDIVNALHYFTLAANQKIPMAQFYLGLIYSDEKFGKKYINKAINYFKLAADQNIPEAQNNLALIYHEGKYVKPDIDKAIYYYSLASNQNNVNAQRNLGNIFYKIQRIKDAIRYYLLASFQSDDISQFMLGLIYYNRQHINQAIYYFNMSADKNNKYAQFYLGMIYNEGKYVKQDIKRALIYLNKSAKQNNAKAQYFLALTYLSQNKINICINFLLRANDNNYYQASFVLGYFYQAGKYVKKNIKNSIKFYKSASSLEYQYAKNNLGIICKNEKKKFLWARDYFTEAINKKKDILSMYNLAHLYIYNLESIDKSIDKSINLLIQSSNEGFAPSNNLLCIALIKKYESCLNDKKSIMDCINQYLVENYKKFSYLSDKIIQMMLDENLLNRNVFEKEYEHYKNVVFIYDILLKSVKYSNNEESKKNQNKNLTNSFYEGLGLFK